MTTDPDQIRAQITALLEALPDGAEIDELARQLEQAHDVLVRALESVEKG